jgi:uncharacterized caspase-like protein
MRIHIAHLAARLCALALVGLACLPLAHATQHSAAPAAAGDDARRIALVIGNGDYAFSPLKNPVNDARAMAGTLEKLGFTVDLRENTPLATMIQALRRFASDARDNDVRLFYYAGHGVQVQGRNYLIPVDAELRSEEEVAFKSADVNELLERLGQLREGLNIMILDACRNNPFANLNFVGPDGRLVRFRGAGRPGLAPVDAPAGTLVAFATAPGSIAMDGGRQSNSLYTRHLLSHITVPGLPVEQLFKRVRIAVAQETKWLQVPWESSSLMGDFCFRTPPDGLCAFNRASLIDPARFTPR